jgi:Fe-S-cluster containining protein
LPSVRFGYAVQPAAPDCEAHLRVRRAVCCYLPLPLSRQDLDEGEPAWSEGYPFQLARAEGRRCVHLDPDARRYTVHDKRPRICRAFDCRTDRRVWQDYERVILTPWAAGMLGQAASVETDAALLG